MLISVTDYANIRNISRQSILKQIKFGRKLPNIKKVKRIGNNYILDYQTVVKQEKKV